MDEELSLLRRLNNFQEEMLDVEILKSKEGYGYSYADLPAVLDIVFPIMKKHGIGYFHLTDFDVSSGKNIVITTMYNLDSQSDCQTSRSLIDGAVTLAKMNKFMVEGSAITYFRRYHLTTMLGLTSDEDSDAGGKKPTKQKPGRSVEATAAATTNDIDYVSIFENFVKNKTKDKVIKSFELYKAQLTPEQVTKIDLIIKEAYGNK